MKKREGKRGFFQCWIIFAAFDSLMKVPGVFGMWHFISTKALSFTAKKKAVGDVSAAPLPDLSWVVFPPPFTVPGSQADLVNPSQQYAILCLGQGEAAGIYGPKDRSLLAEPVRG